MMNWGNYMAIVICKNCGHEMIGNENHYGKLCLNCGFFIEPESDIKLVSENKKIKEKYAILSRNNWRVRYDLMAYERKNRLKDCVDKIKDNL